MATYKINESDRVKEVDPGFEMHKQETSNGGTKSKNTIYWIVALASVAVLFLKK